MGPYAALFQREVRLAVRIGGGALIGVLFFATVVAVVPFGIGPDLKLLQKIGPAILWIGALLATLLGLDRLFQADLEDGALDLIATSGRSLELVVLVKCLANWTATGLPLVLAAPVLSIFLNLEPATTLAVTLTLLVGTPALTFIGAIGAGVTVTLRRGGVLTAVLILPLSLPVLIFGVSAIDTETGAVSLAPLYILIAFTLFASVLGPVAAAAAIRPHQR